jgi:isopenicillin N synthase-like dioxygenase
MATHRLGRTIWEILLQGLGYTSPEDIMAKFSKKPVVTMKLIRTPPAEKNSARPSRYGTGAHTDFGGVTCLLQQPGKDGLEVWTEDMGWIQVPPIKDTLVINVGDMIQNWSGGEYKSVRHRVVNKSGTNRISCATFWLGDVHITNPLSPESALGEETVGEQLYERFKRQYGLWGVMNRADYSAAMKVSGDTCVVQ